MSIKAILFLEDGQYVGFWPSHYDAIRLHTQAYRSYLTPSFDMEMIDQTMDGWWENTPGWVTRHPNSVYTDGNLHTLCNPGDTLVAVEGLVDYAQAPSHPDNQIFGIVPIQFDQYTYPTDDACFVFGPHNGIDPVLVSPDVHLFLPQPFEKMDVREVMAWVLKTGYGL